MSLLITQKQAKNNHKQNIDILEHDYIDYFLRQHFDKVIPVPNNLEAMEPLLDEADAIVLTGGGDVGKQPKRDNIERELIKFAIDEDIPLLGICRGMQHINIHFGGSLVKHKRKCSNVHNIIITSNIFIDQIKRKKGPVNSYHNLAVSERSVSKKLKVFAIADTGYIEGIYHPDYKIMGIQWHPERNNGLSRWIDSKIMDWLQNMIIIYEGME